MIPARSVVCLGAAQLISWGVTYYLVGVFGDLISAELGWTRQEVFAGYAVALLVMGLTSPLVGRLMDNRGGGGLMNVGAVLNAVGCLMLAASHGFVAYYAAWAVMGVGMRLTLYDAAFAALARIGGPSSRRAMAQITLLGGLASTVMWPVGYGLAEVFGWRGALVVYGAFALLTIPLHLTLPTTRYDPEATARPDLPVPLADSGVRRIIAATLFAVVVMLANVLNAAMSAYMIPILSSLGLGAGAAVAASALRGIGQSVARLGEVLLGQALNPLILNMAAAALLPAVFMGGLAAAGNLPAALAFAFFYGAGNGLLTITRGTLPLVLFDHRTYGAFVGRLIVPSFLVSAATPLVYAIAMDRFGADGALYLSVGAALITASASAGLLALARRPPA